MAAEPLSGAREIARWLMSSGRDVPEGRIWPVDPDRPQKPDEVVAHLYSGTSGVVLFFLEAHRLTNDPSYLDQARAGADYLLARLDRTFEREGPGLYTGIAGVAEFFLSLHQITHERDYLDFARRLTEDSLARGTRDDSGLRFVQAENRTEPDHLQAQTGYMQGAAGIGLLLLRLHAFETGVDFGITLPDSPFEP